MLPHLPTPWETIENADWLYLSDDEDVRWTGRPTRYTIAIAMLGGVVLVVIGLLLTWWFIPVAADAPVPDWLGYAPLVLVAAGIAWAGLSYLNWLRILYVVTDEEIYVKHGLISRDITQVRLGRVQNTGFDQSVLERALSFGDVRIYTAGTSTDDVILKSVRNPQRISQLLAELLSDHAGAYDPAGLE